MNEASEYTLNLALCFLLPARDRLGLNVRRKSQLMKTFTAPQSMLLSEALRALQADAAAIAEGRVFADGVRVQTTEQQIRAGARITLAAARETAPRVARFRATETALAPVAPVVLHQDGRLLVLAKPAGMPTIPDHGGVTGTLLAHAAALCGLPVERVHPTSRLDRDVSGVVTFALTAEARESLAAARAAGHYDRRYVALALRAPNPAHGEWNAPIGRASDPRRRMVNGREATPASTRYRVIFENPRVALLALAPQTGRTHQLRVHCAHAAAPLLGDRAYGGTTRLTLGSGRSVALTRVALHAARVILPTMAPLLAEIPPDLRALLADLGGPASAWDDALAASVP